MCVRERGGGGTMAKLEGAVVGFEEGEELRPYCLRQGW